jgi:hypothetical protein
VDGQLFQLEQAWLPICIEEQTSDVGHHAVHDAMCVTLLCQEQSGQYIQAGASRLPPPSTTTPFLVLGAAPPHPPVIRRHSQEPLAAAQGHALQGRSHTSSTMPSVPFGCDASFIAACVMPNVHDARLAMCGSPSSLSNIKVLLGDAAMSRSKSKTATGLHAFMFCQAMTLHLCAA